MIKKLCLLIGSLCILFNARAQSDTSHLRISLITCGPGEEIWETFGHTAIRVVDSIDGKDMVYNYGTFAFGEGFELQFMRGKLLYYLSFYPYENFLPEYVETHRSVEEQVILLDGEKKEEIYAFLRNNALEENRSYKYDFFFDNCATRLRDVFPKSLDSNFKFGRVIPVDSKLTFRDIINQYFYRVHWERFGVNLLLGSPIDRVMTNEDIMFLPDYLRDGIAKATVNGKRVSTDPVLMLPGAEKKPAGVNGPLILTVSLALLTILGLSFKPLKPLGRVMSFLLLLVSGLLGCLILFMWLGTDHQGCHNNFNVLWALPTNLILAFSRRNKSRYIIVAIVLLLVALVLHVLQVQHLPLLELAPLLVALLYVYGSIYKRETANK